MKNPILSSSAFLARVVKVFRDEGRVGLKKRVSRKIRSAWRSILQYMRWILWRLKGGLPVVVNGYIMHVDPRDPGISRELVVYATHEPVATQRALEFANGSKTILDLGSNIGYYALLFLTGVNPRPRLIAVEPSSRNSERLIKNIAANELTGSATILRVAISDHCGSGVLNLSSESNWHTLRSADSRHIDSENVPVLTLDVLVDQLGLTELDLIRMDIEGYETVVLEGMQNVLLRFRPRLIVELHPQLTGQGPIRNFMRVLNIDYGYHVDHVIDREFDYAYLKDKMPDMNYQELLEQDWGCRCFTVLMSSNID